MSHAKDFADFLMHQLEADRTERHAPNMKPRYTFEIYRDHEKQFRWRAKYRDGKIVADSGQGYSRKADCRRAMVNLMIFANDGSIIDSTKEKKK